VLLRCQLLRRQAQHPGVLCVQKQCHAHTVKLQLSKQLPPTSARHSYSEFATRCNVSAWDIAAPAPAAEAQMLEACSMQHAHSIAGVSIGRYSAEPLSIAPPLCSQSSAPLPGIHCSPTLQHKKLCATLLARSSGSSSIRNIDATRHTTVCKLATLLLHTGHT
jgi:hypothetical protein